MSKSEDDNKKRKSPPSDLLKNLNQLKNSYDEKHKSKLLKSDNITETAIFDLISFGPDTCEYVKIASHEKVHDLLATKVWKFLDDLTMLRALTKVIMFTYSNMMNPSYKKCNILHVSNQMLYMLTNMNNYINKNENEDESSSTGSDNDLVEQLAGIISSPSNLCTHVQITNMNLMHDNLVGRHFDLKVSNLQILMAQLIKAIPRAYQLIGETSFKGCVISHICDMLLLSIDKLNTVSQHDLQN